MRGHEVNSGWASSEFIYCPYKFHCWHFYILVHVWIAYMLYECMQLKTKRLGSWQYKKVSSNSVHISHSNSFPKNVTNEFHYFLQTGWWAELWNILCYVLAAICILLGLIWLSYLSYSALLWMDLRLACKRVISNYIFSKCTNLAFSVEGCHILVQRYYAKKIHCIEHCLAVLPNWRMNMSVKEDSTWYLPYDYIVI